MTVRLLSQRVMPLPALVTRKVTQSSRAAPKAKIGKTKNRIVNVSEVLGDLKQEMFKRTEALRIESSVQPHAKGCALTHILRAEQSLYPQKFKVSYESHRWLDPDRVSPEQRQERIQIALLLFKMCIPAQLICLQMIARYKFWVSFLGDERLVRSKLGREYLILSHKTRQVQDNVRCQQLLLRLRDRQPDRTGELLQQLRSQLHSRLENVRESFRKARNDNDYEESVVQEVRVRPQKEQLGCVFRYLSSQLSTLSGKKITAFDVRQGLGHHPHSNKISLSATEARDLLLFLVKEQGCSSAQILNGLYVMLYKKQVLSRSFGNLRSLSPFESWKEHPRLIDVVLYDVERSFGELSSREMFGSAVFIDDLQQPVADRINGDLPGSSAFLSIVPEKDITVMPPA